MIQGQQPTEMAARKGSTYDKWGAQLRQMGCSPTTNGVLSYDKWGAIMRNGDAHAIYDKGVDLMS
jgi:hypothetical protein